MHNACDVSCYRPLHALHSVPYILRITRSSSSSGSPVTLSGRIFANCWPVTDALCHVWCKPLRIPWMNLTCHLSYSNIPVDSKDMCGQSFSFTKVSPCKCSHRLIVASKCVLKSPATTKFSLPSRCTSFSRWVIQWTDSWQFWLSLATPCQQSHIWNWI